jgi:hypothetical protein
MGWASGGRLFSSLISTMKEHVKDDEMRTAIYADMIRAFEDEDCDTLYECEEEDPAFAKAFKKGGE